jgi:2'-5' RNA ligase
MIRVRADATQPPDRPSRPPETYFANMYRLFVAIDMPPAITERIANICYGIRAVRWVPREQLHCTLRFLGDRDQQTYDAVTDALHEVRMRSFSLELAGVGFFPPRKKPRILWAGIRPSEELTQLRSEVDTALLHAGIEPDTRAFHPHITVARIRERARPADITPFLSANNLFATPAFAVEEFTLYSSLLRPEGAEHRVEQRYELL